MATKTKILEWKPERRSVDLGSKGVINALGWELPQGVDDIDLSALDFIDVLEKLRVVIESTEKEFEDKFVMAPRIAELGLAAGEMASRISDLEVRHARDLSDAITGRSPLV